MKTRIYLDGTRFFDEITSTAYMRWIDVEDLLFRAIDDYVPDLEIEKICMFMVKLTGRFRSHQQRHMDVLQQYSPCIEIIYGKGFEETDFGVLTKKNLKLADIESVKIHDEQDNNVNLACRALKDAYTEEKDKFELACFVSLQFDKTFIFDIKKKLKQYSVGFEPRFKLKEEDETSEYN